MLSKETLEFCDYYAIGIRKFLKDNYSIESYLPKYNKKNKEWKVKHAEIAFLALVIPIPLQFCMRYPELVDMGKIIIVRDEFNKYQAYINPNLIMNLCNREMYERQLINLSKKVFRLNEVENGLDEFFNIQDRLASMEEDERIIRHFSGNNSIEYCKSVTKHHNEINLGRKR